MRAGCRTGSNCTGRYVPGTRYRTPGTVQYVPGYRVRTISNTHRKKARSSEKRRSLKFFFTNNTTLIILLTLRHTIGAIIGASEVSQSNTWSTTRVHTRSRHHYLLPCRLRCGCTVRAVVRTRTLQRQSKVHTRKFNN